MNALARLKALRAGQAENFPGDSSETGPTKPSKPPFVGIEGTVQEKTPEKLKAVTPAAGEAPDFEAVLAYHDTRRAVLQFDCGLSADQAKAEASTLTKAHFGLPDSYRFEGS